MKNSQKITRIHLSVNDQDIPAIIGFVSPDPDYKLSLKLNSKLEISLKNVDPVTFQDEEGKTFQFSKFSSSPWFMTWFFSLYQTVQARISF